MSSNSLNYDLTSNDSDESSSFELCIRPTKDAIEQKEITCSSSFNSSGTEYNNVIEQTKQIDNELKEKLVNVVKTASKLGYLTIADFCAAFKDIYKEELFCESYGCLNFKELFKKAGNYVAVMIDLNDGCEKVCLNQQKQNDKPKRKLKRVYCHYSRHLPSDVPPMGTCYRCIKAPVASKVESIYVEVSMVLNPSHFWLQIWGERTTGALKNLMDDLEAFYTKKMNRENYQMKNEDIITGRVCVAFHGGDWQRGTVVDVKSTKDVFIYFVDYGETASVKIDCVCHIASRFMHLQAQALRARLFGVKPKTGHWTAAANETFLTYVQNRVVSCGVRYVNENNVIYCVIGDDKQLSGKSYLIIFKICYE